MKINVYKGFPLEILAGITEKPLIDGDISERKNVTAYNRQLKRKIDAAVLSMNEDETKWMLYEEYAFAKDRIELAVSDYGLEIVVYKNNLLPDYYPIEFDIPQQLMDEILESQNNIDFRADRSEACRVFQDVFSAFVNISGKHYGSYYNYEYEQSSRIKVIEYYPDHNSILSTVQSTDYDLIINDDIETYIRELIQIHNCNAKSVSLRSTNSIISKRIESSFMTYAYYNGISVYTYHEELNEHSKMMEDLIDIAKNDIGIPGFKEFRKIKFYKDPDLDNSVTEISQAQIITDIIAQAESAGQTGEYRDIFITAFTGAGKSVMFQVPAVYMAKKYKKLTIIIEPVKSLMQDQKEQLNRRGYNRVETFNSDLITQTERENVLKRIKEGEVDLLYLSPETLLSYSMETIIGDREIGLIIIDEAHIVTTWGVGFRPDYWYLGGYINNLRHEIKTNKKYHRKIRHFPICAFTATAVNSGIDDSVSETIISLYMENPIKYIGYIKRDDIRFDISVRETKKQPNAVYEQQKAKSLTDRVNGWIKDGRKTVVYFPYASYASDAYEGTKNFGDSHPNRKDKIGIYTGKNVFNLGREEQTAYKKETFEKFRSGETTIMYATKAFGMGVDIDNIENVYHYAATGNLSDYVQEIGRAARRKDIIGTAVTDYYYNDISFMDRLFGMSQIRQYQIQKVLSGIYDTYKAKKESRNFLISPEAFTYIFTSKKGSEKRDDGINQLKTCLLMLEKDLYDKYSFKVLITRPQSVFTKAYIIIQREHINSVLHSPYAGFFEFVEKGRYRELQPDGTLLSDDGDVYRIDLKAVWEMKYQNISFPQFKYWFFNKSSHASDKIEIMPEINSHLYIRQKVNVEAKNDLLLCDLREKILVDFDYIADTLYSKLKQKYFKIDEFVSLIGEKYGKTKARIIANSIFELADPKGFCVKRRSSGEDSYDTSYYISNGTFKEVLRKTITRSKLVRNLTEKQSKAYTQYISMEDNDVNSVALKMLSVFDYITYEIQGGEQPEIFIRLNDPNKIKRIVMGEIRYSNGYVTRAKHKHERDVMVLRKFFTELKTDESRWDFIESYFLGNDVLQDAEDTNITGKILSMEDTIDKSKSYSAAEFSSWEDITSLFDDNAVSALKEMSTAGFSMPEYLTTVLKNNLLSGNIVMSWPKKNILIFEEEVSREDRRTAEIYGWYVHDICNIEIEKLREEMI